MRISTHTVVGPRMAEGSVRHCVRCNDYKPSNEFHNSRTGDFTYCAECRRSYDRLYYKERGGVARRGRQQKRKTAVQAWANSLKEGRPCADCGGLFPGPVMHWDHLPQYPKIGSISDMALSRTRAVVFEELKKCELVCANCHAIRTAHRATRRISVN